MMRPGASVGGGYGRGRLDTRRLLADGVLSKACVEVPLKKVPVRVAKYDVQQREAALGAAHAMHAILSHMVHCVCVRGLHRAVPRVPPGVCATAIDCARYGSAAA